MFYSKFASTKAWKVYLCAVAILLVSGCAATVDLASSEDDAAAKLFIAPQGESNIYVTRKSQFTASVVLFQVVVDRRVEGGIAPGTYRVVSVEPGPHSVSVTTPENQSIQKVDAVAGENYFFEVRPKTGWVSARVEVVQLTESDGRAAIAENSLAEASQFARARSRDSDNELAQLADSFAETEPPDGSPGYQEVVETFLDFAVAQDLDNMVEMVSPSGLNEHGIDTVKEYYANDVVPFFSDFVKLHNVSAIAPTGDEYGHKGITRYLYSVTKSGADKPFAIQLLIEDGKVVVGKVIVGECFRPHHPFC